MARRVAEAVAGLLLVAAGAALWLWPQADAPQPTAHEGAPPEAAEVPVAPSDREAGESPPRTLPSLDTLSPADQSAKIAENPSEFTVTGTIVGVPPDAPVVAIAFLFYESNSSGRADSPPVKSEFQDGRLTLRASENDPAAEGFLSVHFMEMSGGSAVGSFVSFLDPIGTGFDAGEIRLGDTAPVVAAGTVRNASGTPTPDVEIQAEARAGAGWFDLPGKARTGPDGRFALRAELRGAREVKVKAGSERAVVASVVCAPGTDDLLLESADAAALVGTVDVPPGLPLDQLEVVVHGPGVSGNETTVLPSNWTSRTNGTLRFVPGSTFRVLGLRPGSYDVTLLVRRSSSRLDHIEAVQAGVGVKELRPLVVGEEPRRVRVTVLGLDGRPTEEARVWCRDEGGFRPVSRHGQGEWTAFAFGPELEVAAHIPGGRFGFQRTTDASVVLQIEGAANQPCTIGTPPGITWRAADWEAFVRLEWVAPLEKDPAGSGDPEVRDPRTSTEFDARPTAGAELTACLTEPGWYKVCIVVRVGGTSSSRTLRRIRADGSDTPVVVRPEISQAKIDEILRNLRR